MRHVDEGTIHAWLDEQITDPAEAAWIDEHLRTCAACGARMAEERATFERARGVLESALPEQQRPSFESLVARSAHAPQVDIESRTGPRGVGAAVWLRAGWAASVVLALGLGWAARDLTGDRQESVLDGAARVARVEDAQQGAPEVARQGALAPPPAAPEASESTSSASDSSAPRRAVAPEAGAAQGGMAAGERVPPVALPPTAEDRSFALTQAASGRGTAANASAESGVIGTQQPAQGAVAGTAAQGAVAGTAAPPAAPLRYQAPAAGGAPAAAPPSAPEWRPVPRTEAAVRAGMPLYSIEGVAPVVTSVSADGRAVRTLYRTESGELVELTQSRGALDPRLLAAQPMPVDTAARALTSGTRSAALSDADPPAQRTWTTTRGDVRVLLRTTAPTADLDALGARLHVD